MTGSAPLLLRAPRVRAELVAAGWELFSALLFISAVVPAVFETPWPGVLLLGSMAASAALGGALARRGERGLAIAGAIRAVSWPIAISPLLLRQAPDELPGLIPPWLGVLVAALGFGLMAGGMRRAIYRRFLEPEQDDAPSLPPDDRAARALASHIRPRLAERAMTAGIVGGHVLLLFSVAFLRTQSHVIFQAWVEAVPVLALVGTGGFTFAVRPATRALERALAAGPAGDPALLRRGLAQAERLPDVLAYLNFGVWMACTVIGVLYVRPGADAPGARLALAPWSARDALVQIGFGALFAFGVSFYQRAWHRDAVGPAADALRAWTGAPRAEGARVPLRRRMLRDFGLPLLFTGLLSLFSSIALYRALARGSSFTEDFNAITALFASFALVLGAALGVVARAASELSRPMARLARAADEVARGKLDAAVPALSGPEEIAGVGESVERMRQALSSTIAELQAEREGLEANVEARTAELSRALAELKRTQAALVHGERLASIGELVAGVAHEIGNPLNAIAGAAQPLEQIAGDLRAVLGAYREAEALLPPERRQELARRRAEIDLDGLLDDLAGISAVVRRAVDRSVRIVTNLKNFSRVPGEALPADLHAGLEETLLLLGPRLRESGIEVVRRFGDLPEVVCRGGEINQVFMNLLVNAIQALEPGPQGGANGPSLPAGVGIRRIGVETWREGGAAVIAIADSGPGVPADLAQRIFDPFFTTKPRGQGTGLGLSISTEIVRRHGGSLALEPSPDGAWAGARFVCRLPFHPRPPASGPGAVVSRAPTSAPEPVDRSGSGA